MVSVSDKRIAVLIDADNVSDKYISGILDELTKFGSPTYKRIYGDWTSTRMAAWKSVLLTNSITPIQQYSYTVGKNATDSALIIDAMDILYSGNVDSFCIVSSDSDFTKLAARLREAGMYVIGMGEKKTPPPFIAACEVFRYLEVLAAPSVASPPPTAKTPMKKNDKNKSKSKPEAVPQKAEETPPPTEAAEQGMASRKTIEMVIRNIIAEISDEDGWVALGSVGTVLIKRYPDFDTRNYGFKQLSSFVGSYDCFELEKRPASGSSTNTFVRNCVK